MAKKKNEIKGKIIKPNCDNQRNVLKSNCDYVIITGAGGGGKTHVACMYNSYDIVNNPEFSGTYMRKNIGDFFADGGIADAMEDIYPLRKDKGSKNKLETIGEILTSDTKMGVYFDNGATLRFKHIADESNQQKVIDSFKGLQTNRLIFDEADAFSSYTVFYAPTRMRGKGEGKRQVLLVQNPERKCFVRQFCGNGKYGGGWIAETGEPILEMNGVVRFFHIVKGDVNNVFWGKTKKEVYDKCKDIIDAHVYRTRQVKTTYETFIQSCVFYTLRTEDNVDMIENNPDYLGSIAMSSGSESMAMANWNYSKYDEKKEELTDAELNHSMIARMFQLKPNINDKLRIVVDPARGGIDNFTMMAFQGFHCIDFCYFQKNTAVEVPLKIHQFMLKHNAKNSDLIVDGGDGFSYISHQFPGAYIYLGTKATTPRGKEFHRIRDEAGYIMCQMIREGKITFDSRLSNITYKHQKVKDRILVDAMSDECKCYVFRTLPSAKKKLLNKTAQTTVLGGNSSDLTDLLLMLCAGLSYDCYRELAGMNRNTLTIDGNNPSSLFEQNYNDATRVRRPMRNVANFLSKKLYGI